MRKVIDLITKNFDNIYILFLFIISLVIVLFLFPSEGKFKYEFQKGQPWMHEDLVAPFDFAIKKMDDEINEEKTHISESFSPYFNYNKNIGEKQIDLLKLKYSKAINKLKSQLKNKKHTVNNYNIDSIDFYFNKTVIVFESIYDTGILDYNEDYLINNQHPETINIVKNKVAENFNYEDVYTLKSAYSYLINELSKYKFNNKENENIVSITDLNINQFLQANLSYDKINSEL